MITDRKRLKKVFHFITMSNYTAKTMRTKNMNSLIGGGIWNLLLYSSGVIITKLFKQHFFKKKMGTVLINIWEKYFN